MAFVDDGTQAVGIDFTILISSGSEYVFVNTNILFEFAKNDQVTATRMDVHPIKYSTFSRFAGDGELSTEIFRLIFLLFTLISAIYGLCTSSDDFFSRSNWENYGSEFIFCTMQITCFYIKIVSARFLTLDPVELLAL